MNKIRGNQTTQRQLAKEFRLTLSQDLALSRLSMSQRITMQQIASNIAGSMSVVGADAKLTNISETLPIDVLALIQWVMREAYLESTEELRSFTERVTFFNEQKKQIRDQIKSARGNQSRYRAQDPRTKDTSPDSDSIRQQMLRIKHQLAWAIKLKTSSAKKRPKK